MFSGGNSRGDIDNVWDVQSSLNAVDVNDQKMNAREQVERLLNGGKTFREWEFMLHDEGYGGRWCVIMIVIRWKIFRVGYRN